MTSRRPGYGISRPNDGYADKSPSRRRAPRTSLILAPALPGVVSAAFRDANFLLPASRIVFTDTQAARAGAGYVVASNVV